MNFEKLKKAALEIFNKYFVEYLKNSYTKFDGRANRSMYWYFTLCVFVLCLPLILIDTIMGIFLLTKFFLLAVAIPSVGLGVRRLHDLGKPGFWFFIIFVPVLGLLALWVFFCFRGENKANEYGDPVKS